MNNILLFEYFSQNLELKNDLQNHLSQFPYLAYTIKNDNIFIIVTFNKDVNTNYGLGILDPFEKETLQKFPLSVKITAMKDVDTKQEFQGKTIIQNIEKVDFPDFGLKNIEAKCDSGATTSSIGVSKLKINRQTKKVTFIPLIDKFDGYRGNSITIPIHSEIKVQSSNGDETSRILVKTDIVIKGKIYETFISLSQRNKLDYPVLLGKDVLVNFLLQPGL